MVIFLEAVSKRSNLRCAGPICDQLSCVPSGPRFPSLASVPSVPPSPQPHQVSQRLTHHFDAHLTSPPTRRHTKRDTADTRPDATPRRFGSVRTNDFGDFGLPSSLFSASNENVVLVRIDEVAVLIHPSSWLLSVCVLLHFLVFRLRRDALRRFVFTSLSHFPADNHYFSFQRNQLRIYYLLTAEVLSFYTHRHTQYSCIV